MLKYVLVAVVLFVGGVELFSVLLPESLGHILFHVLLSCALSPARSSCCLFRCVAAEIERISLIESGDLDEDEAHGDPVPAITKVGRWGHMFGLCDV